MKQENFVLIISSPSGAGKTSLSKKILFSDPKFVSSVSVTTRNIRPGEIEGEDYFFVGEDNFNAMIQNDHFLEYARVFNNFYGSPKQYILDKISSGFDVLFDIDWQGAQTLREKLGPLVVSIFILPPSMKELENRLKLRGQDSDEIIATRMNQASDEISKYHLYDYVLINKNFDKTLSRIRTIIKAERLRHFNFSQFVKKIIESK